ncbi:MAG: SNF1-interacting protein [Bogoriella megaspora]|nr:MAG: SNF1-interacting protein [Bogoriella megaspora]
MGNNSSKGERPSGGPESRPGSPPITHGSSSNPHSPIDRPFYNSSHSRGSRPDLSTILSFGSDRDAQHEVRRETRQERDARRAEKERIAREKERERSLREESVDGGYLVTLGTYTGPEDFNKGIVRQLMIERRLAPFWKGLNDHSDSWTELQLVAAVKGLPIPAADEVPEDNPARAASRAESNPTSSQTNINSLTIPITSRSQSYNSDHSMNLGPSHPAFSSLPPTSPISPSQSANSPLFRGRAKTLASLTSKGNSSADMIPQEVRLPDDPYVNGQAIEAYLYKDASECPICFLYYPPHLNKTRCCDQPICSECFVQIKRPDPHPPEHHEPSNQDAPDSQNHEEDDQLVSEPSACPFCCQPEFGVIYDQTPPFRRGLVYNAPAGHPLANATSAMSSSSSLSSGGMLSPNTNGSRRRTISVSATAPTVITTDRVRPDWAKKLADARAHALRRSAAATALHNAAYVLGNSSDIRFGLGGRRRRTLFAGESPLGSGSGTPREGPRGEPPNPDLFPGRVSSRGPRGRIEDLEELMMTEAIRLSLQAEEERKRKEEKEARREEKKEKKQKKKDGKKLEKEMDRQKKQGGFFPVDIPGMEPSSSSSASAIGGRNYMPGTTMTSSDGAAATPGSKGKAIDRGTTTVGYNPLSEPTSTINSETHTASQGPALIPPTTTAQDEPSSPARHLELSRSALLADPSLPSPAEPSPTATRPPLATHSSGSSSSSSSSTSAGDDAGLTAGLPPIVGALTRDTEVDGDTSTPLAERLLEPVDTNITGDTASTGMGKEPVDGVDYIEGMGDGSEHAKVVGVDVNGTRSRGDSGESSGSREIKGEEGRNGMVEKSSGGNGFVGEGRKDFGKVSVLDQGPGNVGQMA